MNMTQLWQEAPTRPLTLAPAHPASGDATSRFDADEGLTISCDECTMQASAACEDCVVTFLCDREPDDAVIIDAAEARAVRMLGRSGLVPLLRHRPRAG